MNRKGLIFVVSIVGLFIFAPMKAQLVNFKNILKNIVAPTFPNRNFNITNYGALNDGVTDSRSSINKAITVCSNQNGGAVIVPSGKYYVAGSIILKSNVNLHLEEGAEIIFSSNPKDYTPFVLTNWEGTQLYNYSPLVYAYQVSNIAITGKGTLNGSASKVFATWRPQGSVLQNRLRQMGIDQMPVAKRNFGLESNLPPSMIQFVGCNNILLSDVRIVDSPYWVIHPVLCNNVTVRGVEINSYNLNNDGCDPEYTLNVLIENCTFNVGDDAIAIKAGRDQDGWRVGKSTENIIIRNCVLNSKCNGLCIGSEMSAGVQNVFMENVKVKNCLSGIYFKSNPDRGGFIRNIWVRNVECDSVRTALIRFETNYHGSRGGFYPTLFQNFLIENVKGDSSGDCGFYAVGLANHPLKDIQLKNVSLRSCKIPYIMKNVENVTFEDVTLGGTKMPVNPAETSEIKLDSY
ncbi:MAG: glycoside hydrolase family 28 protein [Paludibacter sp.]|nr:glycoside hydrolase family 28 protein [Paludibacter sp.]